MVGDLTQMLMPRVLGVAINNFKDGRKSGPYVAGRAPRIRLINRPRAGKFLTADIKYDIGVNCFYRLDDFGILRLLAQIHLLAAAPVYLQKVKLPIFKKLLAVAYNVPVDTYPQPQRVFVVNRAASIRAGVGVDARL
jgi:hypothetical protein